MKQIRLAFAMLALGYIGSPVAVWATSITVSLGNTSPGFTNGQHPIGSATVTGQQAGQQAPFNGPCGSDANTNCSTDWTFNYAIPAGESVTAADLVLGIYDIDSAAAGTQVAAYRISGGDDLTSALNAAAEAVNGNTGSVTAEYDVFKLPLLDLAALNSGSAMVQLALQGPGLGVLGTTPFNGAALLFSTLDLTTAPSRNPVLPEPASFLLVATGLEIVRRARRRAEKSPFSSSTRGSSGTGGRGA